MALAWTLEDPLRGGMWLENPSRSGGVAQNGQEQNVISLAMRQRAEWTVPIRFAHQIKAARALLAAAAGKAVAINVPTFEPHTGTVATLATAASLRDTVISIAVSAGPAPEAGRHFGIGTRAYIMRQVDDNGGGAFDLHFYPPLRAAASSGATVKFGNDGVVCEMNLVNDETPLLLDAMRFAQLDLSFVEAF